MQELANALAYGLGITLVLLGILTWIGKRENRCPICKNRGFYEATESYENYDVIRSLRCPCGSAARLARL